MYEYCLRIADTRKFLILHQPFDTSAATLNETICVVVVLPLAMDKLYVVEPSELACCTKGKQGMLMLYILHAGIV